MHFSQRAQNPSEITLKYKDNIISQVDSTKFLGLFIDKKLNWKNHTQELSKKISKLAYALYKLSQTVNTTTLLTAYHGMVESNLRYGVIFWGNAVNKDNIFKIQKRCIRSMFKIKSSDSCKPLFQKHKILTFPSLYLLEVALFVKCNPNLFPLLSESIVRNRRDDAKICTNICKTTLKLKSIICMGPKVYNKLPKTIRELNATMFKRKLIKILQEKCYYSVNEFFNDNF